MRTTVLIVLALLAGVGCTRKRVEDFTPAPGNARSALEKGLQAWKDGQSPGMVTGASKPAIQAEDFEWKAGQKLQEYEILSEEPTTNTQGRVFTVRLKTDKGKAREVKYTVIGIDPMLVFRDVDFAKLSGTGH